MTVKITKAALNLREELADLRKPSGIAGESMLRADTVQEQRDLLQVGRKNLIINGGFDVWQRGESNTYTGSTQFTADRWYQNAWNPSWGNTSSVTEKTTVDGMNAMKITAASDLRFFYLMQKIEDVSRLQGRTVTISFYAKLATGTLNVNPHIEFKPSNVNTYVTKGVTIDTQWKKHSVTITLPSSSDSGGSSYSILNIFFAHDLSGNTLHMANVQLELGSVASEFEHRSYGEELALCQRYYQRWETTGNSATLAIGQCWSTASGYVIPPLFMPLRIEPTAVTMSDLSVWQSNGSAGSGTLALSIHSSSSHTAVRLNVSGMTTLAGAGSVCSVYGTSTTAYLALDAEL